MPTLGPRRIAAFTALWKALTRGGRPGAPGIGDRLTALPRLVTAAASGRFPEARGRLVLIVLGLAYLVSPVDLVPELLLGLIGLGDDAVVALWIAGAFLSETDRFLSWERTAGTDSSRPTVIDQPPPR
ncbi:DUF1232 domain-containing protein [Pseudonocardia sp. KRD-169]|uniref:DUF1232 domain-containing protein n=1 Tax=Pseudonocardia abyssalis TaxID=2792008 RepID=A0ABS6UL43_9PSEU|nr:DUF1232 domain-containing protein [Pseudonocardia abyssalis]MBW0132982.1 DUF1232 domain-containing protein [Pseudonocardia abyssalis]